MAIERELPRQLWVPWLAKRIITLHRTRGRCEKCADDGCAALSWARDRLKAYRMAGNRPDRYAARVLPPER